MIDEKIIRQEIGNTLDNINLEGLGKKYEGKVRDNFIDEENRIRTIVCSDRLSAFDRVITTIPFKGQLLNEMSTFWFEKTKDIAPNHIIDIPDPNVVRVHDCDPMPVEIIVRAYITGSAWRAYLKGEDISGITFPEGLKEYQKLEKPIITPSTKAAKGEHDLPISRDEIISSGLVDKETYEQMEKITLDLFDFASKHCAENNLILVDCKFEYGKTKDGKLVVIDEIFTPDASRFWMLDSYKERIDAGKSPVSLDKEFFRQWLISEKNYMGEGQIPDVDDDVKVKFVNKYVQSFEMITGETFKPALEGSIIERIKKNLNH